MNTSYLLLAVVASACTWPAAAAAQQITFPEAHAETAAEDIFELLAPLAEGVAAEPDEGETTPPAQPRTAQGTPAQPAAPPTPLPPPVASADPDSPALQEFLAALTPHAHEPASAKAAAKLPGEFTRLTGHELRILLRHAAGALADEIEKIEYSQRWKKFLQIDELLQQFAEPIAAAGAADESPNSDQRTARLQVVLHRYDKINADPQYAVITKRHSFQTVRMALAEYLSTPADRDRRRQMHENIGRLSDALDRAPSGKHWVEFLELEDLARLTTSPGLNPAELRQPLTLILGRFEQVAADPRYGAVTSLPGFLEMQLALAAKAGDSPEDAANTASATATALKLITIAGPCSQCLPQTQKWLPVDGERVVASGSGIKTGDGAAARLLVGEQMAVHLEPGTSIAVEQFVDDDELLVTSLSVSSGAMKIVAGREAAAAIAPAQASTGQPRRWIATRRVAIKADGYVLTIDDADIALEIQHAGEGSPSLATIYAGSAKVEHATNGDNLTIRAGRQAVLVPAGVAVRAAAARPADWWPQVEAPTSTANLQPEAPR